MAIFHQYTEKLSQAALTRIFCLGLVPLLLAVVLSGASLEGLIWGIALGPVIPAALPWLFRLNEKSCSH